MSRYYTRVCNFYYGAKSKLLVKRKKTLPLHNNPEISFDKIEIIKRNNVKKISFKQIKNLPYKLKKIVKNDLSVITKKKSFKDLSQFGIMIISPIKDLEILKEDIEKELYELSSAHYNRYFIEPINYKEIK